MSEGAFNPLEALRAIRGLRALNGSGKAVLSALVSHANKDGCCFPSYKTIAEGAGVCVRTAMTVIKSLRAAGYVTVTTRHESDGTNTSNFYQLTLPASAPSKHTVQPLRDDSATVAPSIMQRAHNDSATVAPKVSHLTTQLEIPIEEETRASAPPPQSSFELKVVPSEPEGGESKESTPHQRVIDAFKQSYLAARNVEPLLDSKTGRGAKELLKAFNGNADEAIAVIRRAFQDDFVASKMPCLVYIASKVNSFRGTAPAGKAVKLRQEAPATGSAWGGTIYLGDDPPAAPESFIRAVS